MGGSLGENVCFIYWEVFWTTLLGSIGIDTKYIILGIVIRVPCLNSTPVLDCNVCFDSPYLPFTASVCTDSGDTPCPSRFRPVARAWWSSFPELIIRSSDHLVCYRFLRSHVMIKVSWLMNWWSCWVYETKIFSHCKHKWQECKAALATARSQHQLSKRNKTYS